MCKLTHSRMWRFILFILLESLNYSDTWAMIQRSGTSPLMLFTSAWTKQKLLLRLWLSCTIYSWHVRSLFGPWSSLTTGKNMFASGFVPIKLSVNSENIKCDVYERGLPLTPLTPADVMTVVVYRHAGAASSHSQTYMCWRQRSHSYSRCLHPH